MCWILLKLTGALAGKTLAFDDGDGELVVVRALCSREGSGSGCGWSFEGCYSLRAILKV